MPRALVEAKRVVRVDVPAGAGPGSRLRRYRIADPYLQFWFRYCAPHLDDMARGRADLAIEHFDRDYGSWRGKAMEPVVHDAGAAPRALRPATRRAGEGRCVVGSPWRAIKWRLRRAVSPAELHAVAGARAVVPNAAGARLAVVCPAGVRARVEADLVLGADDLLRAFR